MNLPRSSITPKFYKRNNLGYSIKLISSLQKKNLLALLPGQVFVVYQWRLVFSIENEMPVLQVKQSWNPVKVLVIS